ncbi:RHS domain-containing protein [Desulfosarcina sp. OttesenSCG-928-G10]|nr:RHS domain-containing protein [Desulfosarcina sp. OttesenSCG-928-G10]
MDQTKGTTEPQLYYFHCNASGQPEELTDANGNILWHARYATWGKLVFESTTSHAPFGFEQNLRMQGQYDDRITGLYYNTFRYYDPDIGRFTTEDPIGLIGGTNLYQYAPNPLSWIDPWGLKCSGAKSGGKGYGGNKKIDRAAAEIDAAAQRANRLLGRGGHMNTPWGKIYQRVVNNSKVPQWFKNVSKGNAVQQITDKLTQGNRYLEDIGIVRNKTGQWWGKLRPDYHAQLPNGKVAVFDITTPGQGSKIGKYNVKGATDWLINIFY